MQTFRSLNSDDQSRLRADREFVAELIHRKFRWKILNGSARDIELLQQALNSESYSEQAEAELMVFGTCLGDLLASALLMSWVRYDDEHGVDLALRYGDTSIAVFPRDMIIKRVEQVESPDLQHLYDGVIAEVRQLVASGEYS